MDMIYLHGLSLETLIGVWEWERKAKQTIVLDLDIGIDITGAAGSDSIEETVDYQAVATRLVKLSEDSSFRLVEAFAAAIADILILEFKVAWVRVRLNKQGALREARSVGVIIERGRNTTS
ncbi:MAG: dihydroneopterin aldolase [Gammaproteobacteria bacterium]|jgi:7,8-dihydroneopterin aldolase/epimerase/oxygenase